MCQSFLLRSQKDDVVVSRSMEFPPMPSWQVHGKTFQFDWHACLVPAGTSFSSHLADQGGGTGDRWHSTYRYVGITGFSKLNAFIYGELLGGNLLRPVIGPFSSEGVNECGLSASLLTYDADMEWSDGSGEAEHKVYWFLFVDYVLGQYANVEKLRSDLQAGQLLPFGAAGRLLAKLNQPCHFIMHDQSGDWLVVEVNQGRPVLYDRHYLKDHKLEIFAPALNGSLHGLLTNAPGLDWHYTNFRQYFHLSPYDPARPTAYPKDGMRQTSHGSGMVGLPGDYTSPSRFTRLANALRHVPQPADLAATICLANHLLNSATIVEGLVMEEPRPGLVRLYDHTDWVTIKQLSGPSPVLYYRPYGADPLGPGPMYRAFTFADFPATLTYVPLGAAETPA